MKVLLYHADGKLPNLALMRISAHHKALGDEVELRRGNLRRLLWDSGDEKVYCSTVFEKTRGRVEQFLDDWPDAIVGGTGWDVSSSLEAIGIKTETPDYSIYPKFRQSIGFSQRGCRLKCGFCVVPRKEGGIRPVQRIWDIWRGKGHPREIVLLDNDFFGQKVWPRRIEEMRKGGFKVSFCQGINVRFITPQSAFAIASVDYRANDMKSRRIYTAWDSLGDGKRVLQGLEMLKAAGVKPSHIMVYMLIGYDQLETPEHWQYRSKAIRDFGADPYPMPYIRTKETVGFQRWICKHYDKSVSWERWVEVGYRPERLNGISD